MVRGLFGSLSCWNFELHPIYCLAWGNMCFSKITQYLNLSMVSSINSKGPPPERDKHYHTMTCPPLSLTVGIWYCTLSLGFIERRTYRIPPEENKLNLLSSINSTQAYWSGAQSLWALGNSSRAFLFFEDIKGFLQGRRPWRLDSLGIGLTALFDIWRLWCSRSSLFMSTAVFFGSAFENFRITFLVLDVIFQGLPGLCLLTVVPVDSFFLFHVFTICLDKSKSLATCVWLLAFLIDLITAFFKSHEYSFVFGRFKLM